jgi:hypothetical protein
MVEAAGSGIPDGKLHKQLELIPLRLELLRTSSLLISLFGCIPSNLLAAPGQCILVGFDKMRPYLSLAFPWWKSSHHPASLQ